MNATVSSGGGYVSVGFPSTPGRMSNAVALILQTCSAGASGCTHGATIRQWYMAGKQQSDVQLDSNQMMTATNLTAAYLSSSGQLVGSFQVVVDTPATAAATTSGRRRRMLQSVLESSSGSMPLIFAAGDVLADGTPTLPFSLPIQPDHVLTMRTCLPSSVAHSISRFPSHPCP